MQHLVVVVSTDFRSQKCWVAISTALRAVCVLLTVTASLSCDCWVFSTCQVTPTSRVWHVCHTMLSSASLPQCVGEASRHFWCSVWMLMFTEYTHLFNGPLSRTTRVSRCQKDKNQSAFYWSKRQWVAVASSLHLILERQPCQHPTLSFLQARCPSCHPANGVKALKTQAYVYRVSKRMCWWFCGVV